MKILIIFLVLLCNNELPNLSWRTINSGERMPIVPETMPTDTNLNSRLRVRQFQLEIVPPSSGVQFYKDGIIFLSHSKEEGKVPVRHLSFGSVRTYSALIYDTIAGNIKLFEMSGNSIFPMEAASFSSDYNTMYLSLIPDNSRGEKIFRAKSTSSGWQIDENPLDICQENYIYSHPCLSVDGTFIIFSSNIPGSVGGLDLWITRKEGETWSTPENLGSQINTTGNELFASLDGSNNLYFSSDGHRGQGGYDILVARYNSPNWDNPHLLPNEINSLHDELAYTINRKDNNSAFFTTRSRSGKYRTQLYLIDLKPITNKTDNNNLSDRFLPFALASGNSKEKNPFDDTNPSQERDKESQTQKVSLPLTPISEDEEIQSNRILSKQPEEVKWEPSTSTEPVTKTPVVASNKGTLPGSNTGNSVKVPEPDKEDIIYRVQILANTKPVGSQSIIVAGKTYKSFEYLYQGGYRTTIGEFRTLSEAAQLQAICRKNGYSQAFVVAFKNNLRSTDPALFR